MKDAILLQHMVIKYGEQYRNTISSALKWLEENEPKWKCNPLDREKYVAVLMEMTKR
jgi:hypothetical protein